MWIDALRGIEWGQEVMNASLPGIASRLPFETPRVLWIGMGVALGAVTIWRTRRWTLERAWMPLVAASLLGSPLGWVYYGIWLLPGTKLSLWTRGIGRLWCTPILLVLTLGNVSAALWATLGSCYGWTLLALWGRSGVVFGDAFQT
jgi:hypothetical protein